MCARVIEKAPAEGNSKGYSLPVNLKRIKAALNFLKVVHEDLILMVAKLEKRICAFSIGMGVIFGGILWHIWGYCHISGFWGTFCGLWKVVWNFSSNTHDLFEFALLVNLNSEVKKVWQIAFGAALWSIWGARLGPKVGCGGDIRDETGALRALFAGPVAVSDPDVVKLLTVKFALELFCETSWIGKVGLLVEVDSQVVLNWVSTPFTRPWRWWP
ncbi:hypothetical protein V6N12_063316 [Hibiscus sabdariffa]|uniref:RNase H type-1 domain-containing protein n=1 Tax=Hibiscus sabdariffa TaxID=183260 RepID=A0ABR2FBE7_9ROSI